MAKTKTDPHSPNDARRVLDKGGKGAPLPPRAPIFVFVLGGLFAVVFAVATVFRVLPTPLYLLLGLSAATAVIAYWSDQLGMKLGKKRITLFGLRPRQTATLISIASSWLIMLFSVAFLLLIYAPLKNALLKYDETKKSNQVLEIQKVNLESSLSENQKAISESAARNRRLSDEVQKRNRNLQVLSRTIGARQNDLNRATSNLQTAERARDQAKTAQVSAENARQRAARGEASAQKNEAKAQQRTVAAQTRFSQARTRLTAATAQLGAAKKQVQSAQTEVQRANAEVQRARKEQLEAQQNLSSTRSNLLSTREQLQTAQSTKTKAETATKIAVQAQGSAIKRQVAAEAKVANAEAKVADAEAQLSRLKSLVAQAQSVLSVAQNVLSITQTLVSDPSQIAVNSGQVFAAETLPAGSSEEKTLDVLKRVLAQARESVRQDGWQSLFLASLQVNDNSDALEEKQIVPELAKYLSNSSTPTSVRLVAARDHASPKVESEIVMRFLAIPVRQVFAADEVLAQTSVQLMQNDAAGDAQIFNRLFFLVDRAGKNEALKRGVVPLFNIESPNFFAPDTNLRIFEAMRELQNLGVGTRATVKLVAAQAISTVESPRVRFEISAENATKSAANAP